MLPGMLTPTQPEHPDGVLELGDGHPRVLQRDRGRAEEAAGVSPLGVRPRLVDDAGPLARLVGGQPVEVGVDAHR
jgi:hypothetical protein